MKFRSAAITACFFIVAPGQPLFAQPGQSSAAPAAGVEQDPDLAAIRQAGGKFAEAFNRGDAKAVAALWTPDGEYIDESGQRYAGRAEIEKAYAEFFAANPKATLQMQIDSLRKLSADTAIEDGQAAVEAPAGSAPTSSNYSVVHVKTGGQWLMGSARDARTDGDSAYERIADLGWLIGSWAAEERGVRTESVCRWLGDKSFVQRTYTTKGLHGDEATGVQIIGWNAQENHVQSWNFSPDGAVAVGVWSPTKDGWQATMNGATVDGTPTAAINRLQRLDDNAYVWQSIARSVDGTPLPDSDEVVIRRTQEKNK